MTINNNVGMYNLFNTMYQNNMALYNNKLNRSQYPFTNNNNKETGKLGSDAVSYVSNLKTSSKALSGAISNLSKSAFSNNTIVSSDKDTMTVNYSGSRPSSVNPMNVKIQQIATGQQNEGKGLEAKAAYGGSTGKNSFTVEIGGKATELSVNVAAGDTNKDVQQKMADAINKSGTSIKASVETDSKTNTSTLKIESTVTGNDPKNGFKISDKSGNLVAQTGVDKVAKEGQDAVYTINGGAAQTSKSNTVNLGNGISATFKKASEDNVTISRGQDTDRMKKAVDDLVKSYNDLYSEAVQKTNDPKAQNLASRMLNTAKPYSNALANVGIGFNGDGKMTIDTKQLDKAAESGKLEQFFTENNGKNYGYTNQLSRLADNVSRNTSNYVSSSQFGSALGENFAYSSFGDLVQYNFLSAGSIFDFSF